MRDSETLPGGSILLTAHDLHETPWGDGRQLNQLIADGCVGDAVLLPEYLNHCIPTVGRGALTWKLFARRPGPPVHEVMRPKDTKRSSAAGAKLALRLGQLDQEFSKKSDPQAGPESVFIGQIHSGEIFNQYPHECRLEGTCRWLPGTQRQDVERKFQAVVDEVARGDRHDDRVRRSFPHPRFSSRPDAEQPAGAGLSAGLRRKMSGKKMPCSAKPFCDDGNSFLVASQSPDNHPWPRMRRRALHTLEEWVSIDDLVRVAQVYVLTALNYCG